VSWAKKYKESSGYLTHKEADVLNAFGPSMAWTSFGDPAYYGGVGATSSSEGPDTTEEPYAFPLNEMRAFVEASFPNLGGVHHISQGFYPTLVQFALRVDGKILDETITGKQYSYETSPHGLKSAEGPINKSTSGSKDYYYTRGQRSPIHDASYGSTLAQGTAGQKIRKSRAVSLGPEVMPVRVGAIVPLEPGEHTIEIVARRLSRLKGEHETGDFVGVFSRRLTAIELPLGGSVSETNKHFGTVYEIPAPKVETERPIEDIVASVGTTSTRFNEIESSGIRRGSLPNTHLPSKVVKALRTSITTSETHADHPIKRGDRTGTLQPDNPYQLSSWARFPGFLRSDNDLNKLTAKARGTGDIYEGTWREREYSAGWDFISDSSNNLSITDSDLSVTSGVNKLIILADIELLLLRPEYSMKATKARLDDSEAQLREYGSFLIANKYLDLFALFSIGYRTGSSADDWIIASKHRPAMVNAFNWVNRHSDFICESGTNLATTDFISVNETYGTGASDYGFTVQGKQEWCDRRGGRTALNGYGVNIPLMLTIEDTTTINEVAVFTSTTFPSIWDDRHAKYGRDTSISTRKEYYADVATDGTETWDHYYTTKTWASPRYGRGILDGVRVVWGDCKLSVLKLND
jgi:hypothetical protein